MGGKVKGVVDDGVVVGVELDILEKWFESSLVWLRGYLLSCPEVVKWCVVLSCCYQSIYVGFPTTSSQAVCFFLTSTFPFPFRWLRIRYVASRVILWKKLFEVISHCTKVTVILGTVCADIYSW